MCSNMVINSYAKFSQGRIMIKAVAYEDNCKISLSKKVLDEFDGRETTFSK